MSIGSNSSAELRMSRLEPRDSASQLPGKRQRHLRTSKRLCSLTHTPALILPFKVSVTSYNHPRFARQVSHGVADDNAQRPAFGHSKNSRARIDPSEAFQSSPQSWQPSTPATGFLPAKGFGGRQLAAVFGRLEEHHRQPGQAQQAAQVYSVHIIEVQEGQGGNGQEHAEDGKLRHVTLSAAADNAGKSTEVMSCMKFT